MSADELALREALVELFPLGLTDDAPARRKARVAKRRADRAAERRAAREAKLREDARREADALVSLSSRPTRRDDSMPDNGAANRRESWADRVEREAREQAEQLRASIAETETTLAQLREESAKVEAILAAIGAAPSAPPAAAPPATEPAPPAAVAPPPAPPEPPARERKYSPSRHTAALTDEEQAKLRAFAEDEGIFTVKRARELLDPGDSTTGPRKQAVSNFYHDMLADGTIARHGTPGSPYMFYTHRDYHGPVDLAIAKAQGAPAPAPPQPEPTPEPEPEPTGPEGEALLAALAERGPLSTRDLRQMGIADVKDVADALSERGAVVFEREVRDAHGFPYLRLPDQELPDEAIATPSDATRATRRVEADPTTRRAANAAKQMGIFTIKRLDELLNGDRATNSTRATLSIVMKDLVAAGVARRHGPERGAGVFFTHADYKGPVDLVIARGEVSRQALAEEPVAEPEPEPEPAPAPTDMPSELVAMPAASRGGPLAPRIASARDQLKVYNAVARGPSVSGEVAKTAGLPTTRVTAYMRELEEAGLLRRTGIERRGRDQTLGRPGFEFEVARPADAPAAPAPEPTPEPEPEPEPEPAGPAPADEPKLEAVRDAVARWNGPITPGAVAIKHEWDVGVVIERLAELARRGILRDEGVEGAPVYVYVPPDGPGRAHSVQRASAPADAPAAPNGKGATVAGTGRGQKVSNADVRELVEAAKKDGCTAVLAPNGHWRITTRDGRKLLISNSPKSARTVANDRARLRRIGVNV
jgi:hypothetical protein